MRNSHTPTMMLDKTTLATPTMMLDGSLDHCFDVDVANVLKLDTSVIVSFSELRANLNMIPIGGLSIKDTEALLLAVPGTDKVVVVHEPPSSALEEILHEHQSLRAVLRHGVSQHGFAVAPAQGHM